MAKVKYENMRSCWEFGEASECRRGLMCGMGYTEEEQKRPLIAVVNSWNEYNPGHVHLNQLAERVKQGIREAALLSLSFCAVVSALVFLFARPLLTLFIDPGEREILAVGVHYLRVEGVFYVGIGLLFLLYAIYRGLEQAGMSVVLTVISLGLRVALAYAFAPHFGVTAIWLAIPIGWFIADAVGLIRLKAALPH